MLKSIPYGRHNIDQNDIDAVIQVLKCNWLTCGPIVEKFEQRLCEEVHAKYSISCSNGTTALHLSMLALGITTGDVVLVPAITFLASANAARYVGADVVFVDVDPDTGLMTAKTLEDAIINNKHRSLRAVVNVHLAGQCEDLQSIYNVARRYNLLIIEDAAHAIGTTYIDKYNNRHPIGSNAFSDVTTFSFHPVKTIATGEGGAITTNNSKIAEKLKLYRSHGMLKDENKLSEIGPWYYEMQQLGYNYRISDINCALGLSQLDKLRQFKEKRDALIKAYDLAFKNNNFIRPLKKLSYSDTCWHLYVVFIDYDGIGTTRKKLMLDLKQQHINTQVHYIPIYKQPYYKNLYGTIFLHGAEKYYESCLSLPCYIGLEKKQVNRILNILKHESISRDCTVR